MSQNIGQTIVITHNHSNFPCDVFFVCVFGQFDLWPSELCSYSNLIHLFWGSGSCFTCFFVVRACFFGFLPPFLPPNCPKVSQCWEARGGASARRTLVEEWLSCQGFDARSGTQTTMGILVGNYGKASCIWLFFLLFGIVNYLDRWVGDCFGWVWWLIWVWNVYAYLCLKCFLHNTNHHVWVRL